MSELPPLDQPQAYVVVGPNDQRGPYTMDLLIGEVVAGRLSDATPVWWPGLADWTTMNAHPAVSAEIARRRAPEAAPPWAATHDAGAAPTPQAPTPQAPTPQAPTPQATAPGAAAPDTAEAHTASTPGAAGAHAETGSFAPPGADSRVGPSGEAIVETEVVEAAVVDLDDGHLEAFADLVRRSAQRASIQAAVDNADSQLVEAVTEGVSAAGFTLAEQIDLDDHHELRFDGPAEDLVVASLGRPTATTSEALRTDHVGLTLSYRASAGGTLIDEGTGEHGEVVITADEWTGQSTSSVRLFLGLDHYLDDGQVRRDVLAADIAAATAVLKARLG